ncbi:MAG: hypothetical protein LBU32_07260 [Clostridiales bacterium]|nr:hypothetical protein [Clostridiales bacterium]
MRVVLMEPALNAAPEWQRLPFSTPQWSHMDLEISSIPFEAPCRWISSLPIC